jgi:hypothetical protein
VKTHDSNFVAKRDDELRRADSPRATMPRGASARGRRFVMMRFSRVPVVAVLSLCLLGVAAPGRADDESELLPRATQQRPPALLPLYA